MRELLAAYRDHEDLISVGAYRRGSNRLVDVAIDMQDDMNRFLRAAGRSGHRAWKRRATGLASTLHATSASARDCKPAKTRS